MHPFVGRIFVGSQPGASRDEESIGGALLHRSQRPTGRGAGAPPGQNGLLQPRLNRDAPCFAPGATISGLASDWVDSPRWGQRFGSETQCRERTPTNDAEYEENRPFQGHLLGTQFADGMTTPAFAGTLIKIIIKR